MYSDEDEVILEGTNQTLVVLMQDSHHVLRFFVRVGEHEIMEILHDLDRFRDARLLLPFHSISMKADPDDSTSFSGLPLEAASEGSSSCCVRDILLASLISVTFSINMIYILINGSCGQKRRKKMKRS